MKRIGIYLMVMAAAVSCEYKLDMPDVPETGQEGVFELSAAMPSPDFIWDEASSIGVYGTMEGDNVRYTLYNDFAGKKGVARFYGRDVSGDCFAYYPYRPEGVPAVAAGRIPCFAVQQFRPTPTEHLAANSVFVAGAVEGKFEFLNTCGLVGLQLDPAVFGTIRKLVLNSAVDWLCGNFSMDGDSEEMVTDGGRAVEVVGLGTQAGPFTVYFVLHEGEYDGLKLEIHTDVQVVTADVTGKVTVTAGEETMAAVMVEDMGGTGSDFEIIPGEFD